ncbi:MAG: oligosaccharide flippase family protein [Chloroflexi bacterium]|nr:oligosaccharide flippase family protein [Chloroflexota bacterium]
MKTSSRGSFAIDALKLMSGSTLAQAIIILAAPVLTRLYGPAAFGILGLFVAITRILTQVSGLRYELAIMLPEGDEEAINVTGLTLSLVMLTSVILVPLTMLIGKPLLLLINATELTPYLWLIPISVFFGGNVLVLNYWHSRKRHFGGLSVTRLMQSTTSVGVQLSIGYAGVPSGGGLITGLLSGQAVAAVTLAGMGWRSMNLAKMHLSRIGMLTALKRYRKFPKYNVWATLMNTISWQLPTFFLSYFFTSVEVGFFALGNRVIELPMRIVGASIAQVFFQRTSLAHHEGDLHQVVLATFRSLVTLSFFPLMLLTFIAPELFSLVFGARWNEAGVYTQILAPWIFFWFISSPMGTLFSVLEKQEWSFRINAAILVSRFLALGIGGYLQNARLMLALFALSGVLLYGFLSLFIIRLSGVQLHDIFTILWQKGWPVLPTGAWLIIVSQWLRSPWLAMASAILAVMLYFLYQWRTEPQLQKMFSRSAS